jgi:hypothetical protein
VPTAAVGLHVFCKSETVNMSCAMYGGEEV